MIFSAVSCGVLSADYMYRTVIEIFMPSLRKALRLVALGMLCFTFGVLLAALIVYSDQLGISSTVAPYASFLSAIFYILYIIGAVLVIVGSRGFSMRPAKKAADVSMGTVS